MTRTRYFMLFAAILTFAFAAGAARADYLKGDPRQCTLNKLSSCAAASAKFTLKHYMAVRTGSPSWDAQIRCSATTGLLKWRCAFSNGAGSGTAIVWFRATASGWKRVVTLA